LNPWSIYANVAAVKKLLLGLGVTLALTLVAGFLFFRLRYAPYSIPQNGMYPGLPAQSHFWARKHPYRRVEDVQRGDIIIFRQQRPEGAFDFVWRVVALPGDRIAIREDTVLVNGYALHRHPGPDDGEMRFYEETAGTQTYRIALPIRPAQAGEFPETTVPAGHVFVLGDNRHHANDSRTMGPVPFASIVARAGWW
jgi:signal peptidase I